MTNAETTSNVGENGVSQEILTTSITPRLMEFGKIFRNGVPSDFLEIKYSQGMNVDSKKYRDQLPISLHNPSNTITFGHWSFGQQETGIIQTVNLKENQFNKSSTGRPFVQQRIGVIDPKILVDTYAAGIRPLASVLINTYPDEKPYLLQRYETAQGQTNESWAIKTDVQTLWLIHQEEMYKRLAIRTTEAILAKRRVGIKNPVILEHAGELTPELTTNLLDTINVLSMALDPHITTISAINTPSLENYSSADLVIKNVNDPQTTAIYPSYIVNRDGKGQEVILGHYSTPAFKQTVGVLEMYETLHGSAANWVKNHRSFLTRN